MKTNGRDFLVYLAGPIAGLTYSDGQGWREYAAANLPQEIRVISPLRAKDVRLARAGIITDSYEDNPLTSQRGITVRDRNDCLRSDLILINLLGAKTVSIGTCIEFGWADSKRTPIVLVMEPDSNLHDHPMIRDIASYRVPDLDAALKIVEAVLMPEGEGTPRELSPDLS
jgi:nucleoside 2-deoxyribosyltransferase